MQKIMFKINCYTTAQMRNGSTIHFFHFNGKLCYRLGMTCYYFEIMYNNDGTSKQNRNKDIMKVIFEDGDTWNRVEVDWSKVLIDAPVLVSVNGKDWFRAHFAKFENGRKYSFRHGDTSWTTDGVMIPYDYIKLATAEESLDMVLKVQPNKTKEW